MEFLSGSLEETAKIAANFAESKFTKFDGATVVGLYGDLGAGKTTFIKYLAEYFGIKETIQSPTFVIMKKYKLRDANRKTQVKKEERLAPSAFELLIHIDTYRIEREEEMVNLGWNEIINNPKNLICVEWPEKIKGIMPPHIVITFEHVRETERKISIA
jgi:tRNA threonylcarbamoyladenosine biosynthesis protein TsaE